MAELKDDQGKKYWILTPFITQNNKITLQVLLLYATDIAIIHERCSTLTEMHGSPFEH